MSNMTTQPTSKRSRTDFLREPAILIELFLCANLAFLTADIYMAHSINSFRSRAEWIPFAVSLASPPLLVISWLINGISPRFDRSRWLGILVGLVAIAVGVTGMLLHLESRFFEQMTIRNLVYTAPFVAPLAYTGLGLLILLNRMMNHKSQEWAQWILFLALGGFFGNFVLSLADHAQNGFHNWREWIGVFSSALAIGFLLLSAVVRPNRGFLRTTAVVMLLQMATGLIGFALHVQRNMHGTSANYWENFLYGAPAFAPLLFPNLAMLALIGLWALHRNSLTGYQTSSPHSGQRSLNSKPVMS